MNRGRGKRGSVSSLALLWGARERPSRQARSELNLDRIVTSAIELADAEGLAAVSMRRVAESLRIGTMTLYTYLPGKDELIDLMLDTCYAEAVPTEEPEGDWRSRLELIARRGWRLYRRHPWILELPSARPALGPNAVARYEHDLRAVADIGLSELEMDLVVNLVTGHVEGIARRRLEASRAEQRSGMTDRQWWEAHAPVLRSVADSGHFPLASRVGEVTGEAYGGLYEPERAFEFGLQRVLDGIEAFIERHHTDDSTTGGPAGQTL
ncbi:TetR/AcrR family transcriptional regulator [Streptomyces sp. ST2-7A]|uniref:TetR/AcrR family transcriptional regulator n=1 Tax=Streptomyces sp. ST2-7A TaxID=2907214 RepID=UPI001F186451|nr:TetR/AcrR family transcriptional regulator [Streptomyces sp. ST2-7A]MCE7081122.1 TetR/AcrR family transcriptional regulator [Streptomyces sp. ST2-7A]